MRPLEDIIEDFETQKAVFRTFTSSGDNNKDTLLEFQHRFVDLKSDLRYWHSKMISESEKRNDKQATGIKYRLAVAMVRGDYKFPEDEVPMYDKPPAIGNAEKFASASKEYKKFLEQRVFYKESLTNISDLRDDIQNYIILIRDRHSKIQ